VRDELQQRRVAERARQEEPAPPCRPDTTHHEGVSA
jgi:hypothetical protein